MKEEERAALIFSCVRSHAGALSTDSWALALSCAARLCDWTRASQLDGPRMRRLLEGGACDSLALLSREALPAAAAGCPSALKVLHAALHGAGNAAAAPTAAAKAAFEGAGLVEICCLALRGAGALHPRAAAAAGRALGNAAFGGAGRGARVRALQRGGLAHAAAALRAHAGDRAAARWVAHAAGNLCYEGAPNSAQGEAAALGVAPLVVAALRSHGEWHAASAGTLLDALANLLFRNRPAWERAVVEGGGGELLGALPLRLLRVHCGGCGGGAPMGGSAGGEEPLAEAADGAGGHGFLSSCLFAAATLAAFEPPTREAAAEVLALARAHPAWGGLRPWLKAAAERL